MDKKKPGLDEFDGTNESLESAIELYVSLFPTELDCQRYVYEKMKSEKAASCRNCGNTDFDVGCTERCTKCSRCGKLWWLTAGTLLSRVKDLRIWCLAIWLIERGIKFNPHRLSKLREKNYSSTYTMMLKIKLVIDREMEQFTEVKSQFFESLYSRRTRETPAREHPRVEEQEALKRHQRETEKAKEKSAPVDDGESTTGPATTDSACPTDEHYCGDGVAGALCTFSNEDEEILRLLRRSEHVHFDTICRQIDLPPVEISSRLAALEIDEVVDYIPGDWYSLSRKLRSNQSSTEVSETVKEEIARFKEFIKVTSHRIGRKYVQLYLSLFWCMTNKRRWSEGDLLSACIKSPWIDDHLIKQFVSKLTVRMAI